MRTLLDMALVFLVFATGLAAMPGPCSRAESSRTPSPRWIPVQKGTDGVWGQEHPERPAEDPERVARELLLGAKDALSSGRVGYLRPHLGRKVYLNLFTGINGYYSSEQAFLILESLFSTYKPISFSFSSRNFSIRNPYGFGPITFERRGKRETAELFLSLATVNDAWVINQITIATR